MRFHIGPPPAAEGFDSTNNGWTRLREPRLGLLLLAALPLGLLMGAGLSLLWVLMLRRSLGQLPDGFSVTIGSRQLAAGLLALLALVVTHEALHALPAALGGQRDGVVIGFSPRHFAPYVLVNGALSREVQLLSGVLPLVVLSVVPFFVAFALPGAGGRLAVLSVLNVVASGADLIMLSLLLGQVPRAALVQNDGAATWWRRSV